MVARVHADGRNAIINMSVFLCLYMYVCIFYVSLCVCIYMCVYSMCLYVCVYSMCLYVFVEACVYTFLYIWIFLCFCIFIQNIMHTPTVFYIIFMIFPSLFKILFFM